MNCLETLSYGHSILKSNNIDTYKLDSELLLANVMKMSREELLINLQEQLDRIKLNKFKKLIDRRKRKEPIAYIFKKKEFWKFNFAVDNNVLIPRPETELIVEEVLKLTNFKSSKHFLDIGTGSGCIILSIIKERPSSIGTALDISKKAIKIATSNAKMHHIQNKVKFVNISVDKYLGSKYDFIVSNPPYINSIEYNRLEMNVKFEPHVALKAGVDGLSVVKKLILKSKNLLKINGKLIFEVGSKQMIQVINLLKKNGFYINRVCKDFQSIPRVIISTKII